MTLDTGLRTCTAGLILALVTATGCASNMARREYEDKQLQRRASSHFDLGVDHMDNGRMALALREFLTAGQLEPDNPRTQFALGNAYLQQTKFAPAEVHLKRALEITPDYHEARLLLSRVYIHDNRFEEAIPPLEMLIDDPTFPGPWRALTNLGWAQMELGRNVEARRSLELSRDYNGRYFPTLLDLGILENQEGHRLEAIEMFRKALEERPGPAAEAEINYRLGEIYVSLGRRDRAISHLTTAVVRAPSGHWGKKSEEYLKLLR